MSQVVSKTHSQNNNRFFPKQLPSFPWKRPLLVSFHGTVASIYGYAIGWQNVSTASQQLTLRSNPLVRIYGKWRFLTYNCLIMQFVAYSLCFACHFVPKMRKQRDYFFTTFAFPIGMLVVSSFWSIWFIAGREYISPASLEPYYPSWLNHATHTIIAPINLAELIFVKHQYSSDKKSLVPLVTFITSYAGFLLYIRFKAGRFVYPFLNEMDAIPVGSFMVGMGVFCVIVYKSGRLLSDFVHGAKSIKDRLIPTIKSSSTATVTVTDQDDLSNSIDRSSKGKHN